MMMGLISVFAFRQFESPALVAVAMGTGKSDDGGRRSMSGDQLRSIDLCGFRPLRFEKSLPNGAKQRRKPKADVPCVLLYGGRKDAALSVARASD